MHVVSTDQIAIIAIVFVVAFASTISSAIRDGDRRSRLRVVGLGASAGFLAVGLYCIGSRYIGGSGDSAGSLLWIGLAALLGFTAKYQDQIGGTLFSSVVNKLIGSAIIVLSSIKRDDKSDN